MTDRIPVVVNRSGGTASALGDGLVRELEAAFAATGAAIEVHAVEGRDLLATVRGLMGTHRRIVVGGGDGSLGGVAGLLAGTEVELGILPLGTLNHLARDLGLPTDWKAAAGVAVSGVARAIDVGFVNDRPFVNNASVGLYSLMVRERTAGQKRRGIPKWLATVPAAWGALRRLPHHKLHMIFAGKRRRVTTPLLFVGNNDYSLDKGQVGLRRSLDDGRLSMFAVADRSRTGLIWFAVRAMFGAARPSDDFTALGNCPELEVQAHAHALDVAIDGEVARLTTPLRFRVAAGALTVVAPDPVRGEVAPA